MREQVTLGNLFVGWLRYFGRIVVKNIQGNAKARALENQYIKTYFDEYGDYPIGNRDRTKK